MDTWRTLIKITTFYIFAVSCSKPETDKAELPYDPPKQGISKGAEDPMPVLKSPEKRKVGTIYFSQNSSKIRTDQSEKIVELAELLKDSPNEVEIEIIGHTSREGHRKYNKRLALERAFSVKNQLLTHGLKNKKIVVKSFEERVPAHHANMRPFMAQNRRVSIYVKDLNGTQNKRKSSHPDSLRSKIGQAPVFVAFASPR